MHAPAVPTIPPEMLLLAYRSGIFPMADGREDPEIFYVEPRRRAILPLDGFRCSHSLAKVLRQARLRVSCNANFAGVIAACAEPRPDHPETWISRRIEASYRAMHMAGYAHSIEVWRGEAPEGELVGGLYGVGFDRVFCGESMFSRADNASKVALAWLVAAMKAARMELLDCQFMTEHLASLGAIEIDQDDYCDRLARAQAAGGVSLGEGLGDGVADGAALGLPEGFALVVGAGDSSPGKLIAQLLTHTS
jgi:leucyl/phenylalanyl-tRNA--protein transferase